MKKGEIQIGIVFIFAKYGLFWLVRPNGLRTGVGILFFFCLG